MTTHSLEKVPDYSVAQSILLGIDFITPEEVAKARMGIVYTEKQVKALAESLPPLDVLRWCKENDYAVMPAPPTAMSTLDIREIQSAHFYSKIGGWYADQKFASDDKTSLGGWYADQRFAHEDKTSFGWLLIKKTPVSDSTSKIWVEQMKLLSALETVPNAAEMCWFITTYFEVRGVRLFKGVYVRTSSLDSDGNYISDGNYVLVGGFDSDGLAVYRCRDVDHFGDIGLSAARKQDIVLS